MVDGLKLLKDMNEEVNKLNRTVRTNVLIDEDKIVKAVSDKLKRELTGLSTQSRGI